MANWEVTSGAILAQAPEKAISDSEGLGSNTNVDLTISNIVDGSYSGYDLHADRFRIGGATESPADTWTGGNVDTGINKVVFSNNGTAGDPANTVNAKVYLLDAYQPSEEKTLYIDIDETSTKLDFERPREIYLNTKFAYNANQGVASTDLPGARAGMGAAVLSDTELDDGEVSGTEHWAFSGTVDEGKSTLVAELTFTATGTRFYKYEPSASFENLKEFEGDYFTEITSTRSSGSISSFVVKVFYSPNTRAAVSDEEVSKLGHLLNINYVLQDKTTAVTNTIYGVNYITEMPRVGGDFIISVLGTVGAEYTIGLEQKSALDSNITASHHNFSTLAFGAAQDKASGTIGSNGISRHSAVLPLVTADTRYDIVIEGAGSPTASLGSNVKTLPEANTITQYGSRTLTISPVEYSSGTSSYGSLPSNITIQRPLKHEGHKYSSSKHKKFTADGGTGGVSSARLILNKPDPRIVGGMIVTGAGVTHGTTVVDNIMGVVTLSVASTIAADTTLGFTENNSAYAPFTFTILPNSNTLNVTAGAPGNLKAPIGGLKNIKISTNAAVSEATGMRLADTKGLSVGMSVSGDGIRLNTDGTDPTIESITDGTDIVVSQTQNGFGTATSLTFSAAPVASSTSIDFIQANKVGSNIVIQGYVKVGDIAANITLPLDLDSIITAS
jgi:hypothetical protein